MLLVSWLRRGLPASMVLALGKREARGFSPEPVMLGRPGRLDGRRLPTPVPVVVPVLPPVVKFRRVCSINVWPTLDVFNWKK